MGRILLVENDIAWAQACTDILTQAFGEEGPVEIISSENEDKIINQLNRPILFEDTELALVDLELGPASRSGPEDYLGRDLVLSKIRDIARWIPVILVSRYISGSSAILPELTPYGFDAIVAKDFFSEPATYRKQWEALRYRVSINRVAALTGRSVHEIENLLRQKIELEYGLGVNEQLESYGWEKIERLMKLIDLGSTHMVLDDIVQGASGLTVIKATCRRNSGIVTWLVKIGHNVQKIDQELKAHRRMFVSGFTRQMSVPVLWWGPVVWDGLGSLAYEFETDSDTMLAVMQQENNLDKLNKILPALKEFYKVTTADNIVPRKHLYRLVKKLRLNHSEEFGLIVSSLLSEKKDQRLDQSASILIGREHGDFHARNILVGSKGPLLIDFAHYLDRNPVGIPLFDLAKLLVDLNAWGVLKISFSEFLSGDILDKQELREVVSPYLIGGSTGSSVDEKRVFSCAVACIVALYSTYPDIPQEWRILAKEALSKCL